MALNSFFMVVLFTRLVSMLRAGFAASFFALLLAGAFPASPASADDGGRIYHALTGIALEYTVQPGDYLIRISARFGMPAKILADENNLDYFGLLHPGDKLFVHSQHIVPGAIEDGILINLPQRMLFFFQGGKLAGHFPVGLGRPDWPTPTGRFKVVNMQVNKDWLVPESIQCAAKAKRCRPACRPGRTIRSASTGSA